MSPVSVEVFHGCKATNTARAWFMREVDSRGGLARKAALKDECWWAPDLLEPLSPPPPPSPLLFHNGTCPSSKHAATHSFQQNLVLLLVTILGDILIIGLLLSAVLATTTLRGALVHGLPNLHRRCLQLFNRLLEFASLDIVLGGRLHIKCMGHVRRVDAVGRAQPHSCVRVQMRCPCPRTSLTAAISALMASMSSCGTLSLCSASVFSVE